MTSRLLRSTLVLGIVLFVAIASAPVSEAGTISISIIPTAEVKDGDLSVKLRVANSGDEAALSVVPILRFRDAEVRGKGTPRLEPGASHEETLAIPAGEIGDGRWPYQLAVDYTDLNQYPFQALQVQSLVVGNPPPAKVAVAKLESDAIAGDGEARVQLKNLTANERNVQLALLLPEGLESSNPKQNVTLDGWEEEVVRVPVTNRTALAGSRYPVFVTVEYDDDSVHQGLVSQGIVAIESGETVLDRNRPMLWWVAGGLLLLFLVLAGMRAARGKRAAA